MVLFFKSSLAWMVSNKYALQYTFNYCNSSELGKVKTMEFTAFDSPLIIKADLLNNYCLINQLFNNYKLWQYGLSLDSLNEYVFHWANDGPIFLHQMV